MNRRSFLSLLAAIPGLGWVQPEASGVIPMDRIGTVTHEGVTWDVLAPAEECQRAADYWQIVFTRMRDGGELVPVLPGMGQDGPLGCACAECRDIVTLNVPQR